MADEHEHDWAETAAATGTDHAMRVEAALRHAELEVASMDPSAAKRRLLQMLAVFRRATASWSFTPPSDRQLEFVQGLIAEVVFEATRESPTVRVNRRPG
jgi:hypothetical protein